MSNVDIKANVYPVGLSLRDYFAAMAISGLANLSSVEYNPNYKEEGVDRVARIAYEIADAMLVKRKSEVSE